MVVEWVVIEYGWSPYKKRRDTEMYEEDCQVTTEVEVGVMILQAKECQRLSAIAGS